MRIALITPEYPGCGPSFGVGAYVANLAKVLSAGGDAVCVAVVAEHGWWLGHADQVHAVAAPRMPAVARAWWASRWLTGVLDELVPDVVEVSNWGGLGAFLPHRWPLVARLSTPITAQRPRDRLRQHTQAIHHRWERATVRRADLVIADSHAIATATAPLYRRMADVIIPHAWTGQVADAVSTGTDVLFVGRLEHRKGIDVLLRAWPAVRRHHPQTTLHVVGADRLGLTQRLRQTALPGIVCHGVLTDHDLDALRRRCAVQVMPSRSESFGLVVLEAWAAGLAVVASDCPGLRETVADAGILSPIGDPPALAAALGQLLAEPVRRRLLADAGRQRVSEWAAPAAWASASRDAYRLAQERARQRLLARR
jgi:glycosyltransferase involved in cell wall biosynthesis